MLLTIILRFIVCNKYIKNIIFPNTILVRVECTPSDMLVHLNLAREFRGRVYATGNPQACFELGGGVSEMTLRIPLGTQCGTVQQVFIVYGQKNHALIIIWFNIRKTFYLGFP